MARTEHLPNYKASYELCLDPEQVGHGFSRYRKCTLGTDLRDGARRVLQPVLRANGRRERQTVSFGALAKKHHGWSPGIRSTVDGAKCNRRTS